MARFRKKPVEIEAIQLTEYNWDELFEFCGTHPSSGHDYDIPTLCPIGTYSQSDDPEVKAEVWDKLHSTWVGVKEGQWIIKGVQGEFYPCDPDVFEASYEPVNPVQTGGGVPPDTFEQGS